MSRNGKTIGIIEKMYQKVMDGKNEAWLTRDGIKVYEMFLLDGKDLILRHYGTTTLVYDTSKKIIKDYYGESASDRDSMNTLLDLVGHDQRFYFRYGPSMGFVLEGPEMDEKPFDEVQFIIDYEGGKLSDKEIIEGFQELIKSGSVWKLQGNYGRTARALIAAGLCNG